MKQKSIYFFLFAIHSIILTNLNAQWMGPEVGVNLANLSISPSPDISQSTRAGLILGIITESKGATSLTYLTELLFVSKGFKLEDTYSGKEYDNKIDYLEGNVFLKYRFLNSDIRPYLLAGLSAGIKLSVEIEASASVDDDEIEFWDGGFAFGGGTDFQVTKTSKLFFQIYYNLGIVDILKSDAENWKNNGIQISSGILFNLSP